jgi:hypothetical protein
MERHFETVPQLPQALKLHVAGPLVVQAGTYAPLASVAAGKVTGHLTARFAPDATSAPRELPGGVREQVGR